MNKTNLKSLISEVVNEVMTETTPPNFPKNLRDKLVKQYGETPKAYATMWSIHNKKNEGDATASKIYELGGMTAGLVNRAEGAQPPGSFGLEQEGLGDWAGWGKKTPAQDTSEKRLEKAGFQYTHHFPADDQDDPEQKMTIVMQKKVRYQTFSGEIEPDGTVSGENVDTFLKNMKARGLREHAGENNMADPEEKREVAIGKQILQLCAQGEKDGGYVSVKGYSVSSYDKIAKLAEELIRMHGSSITETKK